MAYMSSTDKIYDLAFSFAGEDRDYVEKVKNECEKLGLNVYYDKDRKIDQWGKSFIQEQRKVYSGYKTKHFVPFISEHYFSKPIPTDEFKAALMESIKRNQYILPIKIDESAISVEYLPKDIQYLKKEEYTPEQLAGALKYIVNSSNDPAKNVDQLLEDELDLPQIKTVPGSYSKYESAEQLIEYIAKNFESNKKKLSTNGHVPIIRAERDKLMFLLEKNGDNVFALNIFFSSMANNSLGFNYESNSSRINTNSENGTIEPTYDEDNQRSGYLLNDYSNYGHDADKILTREEVVRTFWNKLTEVIERKSQYY